MESSSFFNSVNHDRRYKAEAFAKYFSTIIGNGVFPNPSTGCQIVAGTNMNVLEHPGNGWTNGYVYGNDGDLSLAVSVADGVLHRKDNIVLRWDLSTRSITAQVIKGTPTSSPTAPALVRTAEQYDLKIAEIYIAAGTTAITQSMITDTRLDKTVCGIVTGVITQVETSTLYAQVQADLTGFKTVNEADFTAWVASIKDILNTDEASTLLNMINAHTTNADIHTTITEKNANANHIADTVKHTTQANKDTLAAAVQSATLGGAAVPKSGTTLQIPYTTAAQAGLGNVNNIADANKSVNYASSSGYANSAGSAPANGGTSAACSGNSATAGTANYAHYSSHAVGSSGAALRNITMSTVAPSGGQDGDVWHQYK